MRILFSKQIATLRLFTGVLLACCCLPLFAHPVNLQTDHRIDPLGIDDVAPTLSWQSDEKTRDWVQTAYRIQVATSEQQLRAGKADLWDSGRVNSAESVGIVYAGRALQPQTRFFWRVTTWGNTGRPQTSSESAWWETGLGTGARWNAHWIAADHAAEHALLARIQWIWLAGADAHKVRSEQTARFRYRLHLDAMPEAATLHVVTGGTYTTRVNGHITGHKQEWGSFDLEDIRGALHAGDNEIEIETTARRADAPETTTDAVAAELSLSDHDGHERQIVTDAGWQARVDDKAAWKPAHSVGALASLRVNVGSDRHEMQEAPDRLTTDVSLLRKPFIVEAPVRSARLYITALGAYRASINGQRVGQTELAPGFTDFRKRVLYQTYDVTTLLHPGQNVFGAMLGGGWHSSPLLWSGIREFAGPDVLRVQLTITDARGRKTEIDSDRTWQATQAPTRSAEIYGGESYDARLESPGWDKAGFQPREAWLPVLETDVAPELHVTAQPDLPMRVVKTIQPVTSEVLRAPSVPAGTYLVDMGQNMVGNVRLHIQGARGTVVRMQFAERLQADGSVYRENLRNADATDEYTLRGGAAEDWQPAFTFHGFRYVQISGLPAGSSAPQITGEVINSLPDQPSMRFTSSSPLLNSMFELGLWGQRGNFVSIPTDCPQRDERMGWMGDAGVFWRTGSYNFDIDSFTHKFMNDVDDAQTPQGVFPNIAPNLLLVGSEQVGAPGWGDAGILVPYAAWSQYGDRSIIDEHWAAMTRWMQWIQKQNPDWLRRNALGPDYADWLAPDPGTPGDLAATAYWALIAQQMEAMARATGRAVEAHQYHAVYEHIQQAYAAAYILPDGTVKGGTQTAYVLTLYTGMSPAGQQHGLTDKLVANIEAHKDHLTTGFLGTPFLLFVLDAQGRTDVAYRLLLNDTFPSWGYMVKKGATTWWERWNGDTGDPGMNSYNHYAFGSVMAWVYRRVAGIDADVQGEGFHHMTISPHPGPGLTHAHGEYDSAYGTVTTDWVRTAPDRLQMSIAIPANTTATVNLPGFASGQIQRNGVPLARLPEAAVPQDSAPRAGAQVTIGSGVTLFELR